MKVLSEYTETEIVERATVVIAEYYPEEAKNYLKKYTNNGWVIKDKQFHSANTSKFTLEKIKQVENIEEIKSSLAR